MKGKVWFTTLILFVLLSACGGVGQPSVNITKPEDGAIVSEGSQVEIETGAVGGGQIERVELYVDGTLYETYKNPHLSVALKASFTWQASGAGSHTIEVLAINDKGVKSEPASITIEVK